MRKIIHLSMVLLSTLFVLSACSLTSVKPDPVESASVEPTPLEPVEPDSVETTPSETKEKDRKLQLPAESSVLSLSTYGDSIAAIYENSNGYHVAIFGEEGTLVSELCQSVYMLTARFLDSGKLAVWYPDALEIWDITSNTKECTFAMETGTILDADGQSVWNPEIIMKSDESNPNAYYDNIPKVTRLLADGTQSELEMPDGVMSLLYAQYPYLYYEKEIPDYKRIVCKINVLTQETMEYSDWVLGLNTPMGHLSKLFQSEILMPWEEPDQMFVSHHAKILARDGAILLLQGDDTIRVIDAKKQMLLAEVPFNGEIVAGSVNVENRYFVLADFSTATIYQWEDEGTATDMAETIDVTNISDAIKSQQEELLSLCGITLTNDISIIGEYYQSKPLESELRAYVAGIELTNFFSILPKGMTEEMSPAALQTFPVCLTGNMLCVGLSFPYEESYYLALDVNFLYDAFTFKDPSADENSPMIDTLSHEFLHMMEYRIMQTTLPDGEPLLSLWDTVVPPEEDESFTGTYEGDWDARNSLNSEDPADEIWFENAYSRTMPEEDRATLFACLFSGVHTNGEGWDVYPHLLEKGQLLCAMIRETYPSIKASPEGSMYWERNFEQRPLSDFLQKE